MSQENVEVVRRALQLANARDLESAVAALYDDDAVLHGPDGWPEPGPWRGRSAILGQLRRMFDEFGHAHLVIDAIQEHGEWVIARQAWQVRASRSGVPGEFRMSQAIRFRAAKAVEVRYYWDHGDALRAAGLGD